MNPYGITEVDVPGAIAMYTGAKDRRLQQMLLQRQMKREDTEFDRKEKLLALMGKLRQPGGGLASAYDTAPTSPVEPPTAPPTPSATSTPSGPAIAPTAAPAAPAAPAAAPQAVPQSWMEANRDLIGQMMAVDAPTAFNMVQTFGQLDQAQAKEAQTRNQAIAVAAHHLLKRPEETWAVEFQNIAPGLARMGIPQDMLAEAAKNLTRERLEWYITQARDIEKIIESARPDLMSVEPGGTIIDRNRVTPGGDPQDAVVYQSPVPRLITGADGQQYEYSHAPVAGGASGGQAGGVSSPVQGFLDANPGIAFNSGRRTEQGNRAVGGVDDSAHIRGGGMDFGPGSSGKSLGEIARAARAHYGPTAKVLIERDKNHVHVELPGYTGVPYYGERGTAGLAAGELRYGAVVNGYRYVGGDPKQRGSWRPAR